MSSACDDCFPPLCLFVGFRAVRQQREFLRIKTQLSCLASQPVRTLLVLLYWTVFLHPSQWNNKVSLRQTAVQTTSQLSPTATAAGLLSTEKDADGSDMSVTSDWLPWLPSQRGNGYRGRDVELNKIKWKLEYQSKVSCPHADVFNSAVGGLRSEQT